MPAAQRPPSAARDLIPERPDLDALRGAAAGCTACDLYRDATQTVFGEGATGAEVMLVGEQPGDGEDKAGRPFVGPAGRLLDEALEEAGIDRRLAYVTNVVKHFKFERRGKLRLHKTPNAEQVHACFPWLEAELKLVQPRVLVLLGATAAQALLGSSFRVSRQRGQFLDWESIRAPSWGSSSPSGLAPRVLATVHPSSILRAPDDEARALARKSFVADLAVVAKELGHGS
ncbi:MAG TPA: UdgX family uracil-DNA binding protein [Actinomycetes bacterium]|jgi:DNA polymerase